MTAQSEVTEAMIKLHTRDHTVLGSMLVYLHANTNGVAERLAVLNNALDAVFNFAMMICEKEDRAAAKEALARRILTSDETVYPARDVMVSNQALNELFRAGLGTMANDENLMSMLGALSLARMDADVNDKLH